MAICPRRRPDFHPRTRGLRVMNTDPSTAKVMLRKVMRAELGKKHLAQRAGDSAAVCARLIEAPLWREARSVMLFMPLQDEVDIRPMVARSLRDGKTTTLPRFDVRTQRYGAAEIQDPVQDLEFGQFGVMEPQSRCPWLPLNRLDLILVPGVAFDHQCRRLGRGMGFYDRMLSDVRAISCGIAFDEQIVSAVPETPHDISVECILTPTRWIEAQAESGFSNEFTG